jgi:uncharacterized membrane protein
MVGYAARSGTGRGPAATYRTTGNVARDDEETVGMAEHGRGAGGRHAAPGEARAAAGATATVGAAPTAPIASAPSRPVRAGRAARPGTGGGTHRGAAVPAHEEDDLALDDAALDDDTDLDDAGLDDTEDDAGLDDAEDDFAPVRGTGWVLLVGGLVGAVVALVLLVEKLDLLANPDYIPSCSIDPVLSCGTIMKTAQAAVLGFPNPVIGLLTFPVVAACGAIVVSGAELPRWVWWALEIGSFAGVLFIHWLIVQSLVVIHALCPYCMVAWVAVLAIFWFTTMHNLREGNLGGAPAGDTLVRRHGWGLAAWYLLIVVAVVASFPAYFAAMVGLG